MLVLNEDEIRKLTSPADAFIAVEEVFKTMAMDSAANYPVVREPCGTATFGVKSGYDSAAGTLGLKAGGYWPGNTERGLTNHQSSTLLFDASSGKANALLSGNTITALRTAAACAVSIAHLARKDVRTLGVLGAGAQVPHHVRAAFEVREFERVLIWNRTPERARTTLAALKEICNHCEVVSERQTLTAQSDVLITLTPSTTPIVDAGSVKPGTHIAAMGSDTIGKQELDAALVKKAGLYVDDPAQSHNIGESQAFPLDAKGDENVIIGKLGAVLLGKLPGRQSDNDITIFDSTGVALQDIALAQKILVRARERNFGVNVTF